jgi:hypothetical protein
MLKNAMAVVRAFNIKIRDALRSMVLYAGNLDGLFPYTGFVQFGFFVKDRRVNRIIITPLAEQEHQCKGPYPLQFVRDVASNKVAYIVWRAYSPVIVSTQTCKRQLCAPRFIELISPVHLYPIHLFTPGATVDAFMKG